MNQLFPGTLHPSPCWGQSTRLPGSTVSLNFKGCQERCFFISPPRLKINFTVLLSSQSPVLFLPTWSEKGQTEETVRTIKSTTSSRRCQWSTSSLASCSFPGWRAYARSVHVMYHLHIPAVSLFSPYTPVVYIHVPLSLNLFISLPTITMYLFPDQKWAHTTIGCQLLLIVSRR